MLIYILSDILGGGCRYSLYSSQCYLKGDSCLFNTTLLDTTKKYCKQMATSLYLPVNNNDIGFIFNFQQFPFCVHVLQFTFTCICKVISLGTSTACIAASATLKVIHGHLIQHCHRHTQQKILQANHNLSPFKQLSYVGFIFIFQKSGKHSCLHMHISLFHIVFRSRVLEVLVTGCHMSYITFAHSPNDQTYHDAYPNKGKQQGEANRQSYL